MEPALANSRAIDAAHASREAATAAFVAEGWRETLRQKLAISFERELGSASIDEAVDHALERALTKLRPSEFRAGRPVYRGAELYKFTLKVARDRLLDERRRSTRAAAPLTGVAAELIENVPDQGLATPEDGVLARVGAAQVREALVGLEEPTLQVLALFHVEGLKKPRIEKLLGMSTWEVRRRLRHGNQQLAAGFLAVDSGATCALASGALARFAFGVARGQERKRVREHVRHCGQCAQRLARAQAYRRSLGAMVPLPVGLAGGHWRAWLNGHKHVLNWLQRARLRIPSRSTGIQGAGVAKGIGFAAIATVVAATVAYHGPHKAPVARPHARGVFPGKAAALPDPVVLRPSRGRTSPREPARVRTQHVRQHGQAAIRVRPPSAPPPARAPAVTANPAPPQSNEFFAGQSPGPGAAQGVTPPPKAATGGGAPGATEFASP